MPEVLLQFLISHSLFCGVTAVSLPWLIGDIISLDRKKPDIAASTVHILEQKIKCLT